MDSDLNISSLTEDFFSAGLVLETISGNEQEVGVVRSVRFVLSKNENWSEEFFTRISLAKEILIHLDGWVYKGFPVDLANMASDMILCIHFYSSVKNERESMIYLEDIPVFELWEFGKPLIIKEDGWDLIHLAFTDGFIDFFFAYPPGLRL